MPIELARLSPSSQNTSHERDPLETPFEGPLGSLSGGHTSGGEARESQEAVRLLAKPGGCRYSSTPARTATATENVDR